MTVPDLLAEAAPFPLQRLWSAQYKVRAERRLWLTVLAFQAEHGVDTPEGAWNAYSRVRGVVRLDSIKQRELVTRHDVKARIEEYNALAGYECIHRGMTSADVVDNISQYQILESMRTLVRMWPDLFFDSLSPLIVRYPMRGIKGPVGTQQDQLDLLGSHELCEALDQEVAQCFGFGSVLGSVPQVYHRSLDLEVASAVASCVAGLGSVDPQWPAAATWALLSGQLAMVAGYGGDTWNEGDVSTSVVRRVALPAVFYLAAIRAEAAGVTNVTLEPT